MRVLIVDAFCHTPAGRDNLAEFRFAISNAFEGSYNVLTDLAYAVRDKSKLHDFIYDNATEFASDTALRSFQAIDMVFIGGDDTSLLPWCASVNLMRILVKQCIRMHKPTFCSAFAMQMLVTVCMLEGENVKILNGQGRGSNISGERPQSRVLEHVKSSMEHILADPEECVLDAGTGDLYQHVDQEWAYHKNVGVYNPIFSKRTVMHGSYKSKTQAWEEAKPTRTDELECELTHARFLQHWILKDVPKHFIVPARSMWLVGILPTYFDVLLAGKTPILVTMGPICGFQGIVTRKYPETVKLIGNWIDHVTRALLRDVPYALGFCPEVLSSTAVKCIMPAEIRRHQKLLSVAYSPAAPKKIDGQDDRRPLTADGGRSQPVETEDPITRAFSDDISKVTFQHFSLNEIRRFLHPNAEDIEEVKIKKVVYVGSRPTSQKKSKRAARPFLFAGRASTCNGLPNQIPNFVSITPGTFPCDHKFRTTDKKKWFNPRGFVPASGGWKELPIVNDPASDKATNHIPRLSAPSSASRRRPSTCPSNMGRNSRRSKAVVAY